MIHAQQGGPWGGGGGGYGGPPGGYGGPPGGGGYGGPPGGGGYGGPPGGGGYGPPGGGPPGGYGGPPGGGFGGPPGGPPGGFGGPPMMPQYPGQQMPSGPANDTLAVVSLITGLAGFPATFCCSFFGVVVPLAAIIMGIISMSNISKSPQQLTGKGLAMAGIACGALSIVLFVILFFVGVGLNLMNRVL